MLTKLDSEGEMLVADPVRKSHPQKKVVVGVGRRARYIATRDELVHSNGRADNPALMNGSAVSPSNCPWTQRWASSCVGTGS